MPMRCGSGSSRPRELEAAKGKAEQLQGALVSDARVLLAAIVDSTSDGILGATPDGVILSWNKAAERIFGYSSAEAIGASVAMIVPPDRPDEIDSILARVLAGETVRHFETLRVRKDGGLVAVDLTISPICGASGEVIAVSGVARDVTERRRADESRSLLAAIVDSSDDAILSKTLDGIILSWNKAAERLYGYAATEIVGKSVALLVPPDRPTEIEDFMTTIRRGGTVEHFESERVRKDGSLVPVALTISPIRDTSNAVIGASTIARDITGRKRRFDLERQLAGLKTDLVSRVGHEFRTPLTIIMGYGHLLAERDLSPAESHRAAGAIVDAAQRLERIVELLELSASVNSGHRAGEAKPIDLHVSVDDAIRAWTPRLNGPYRIVADPGESLPEIVVDGPSLGLVLDELIDNAVKFSPAGGTITIETRQRELRGAPAVEIALIDQGVGMTAAAQLVAFDDFMQGDESDTRQFAGLGLGLAVVREFALTRGGTVSCTAVAGGGTRVSLLFPAVPRP